MKVMKISVTIAVCAVSSMAFAQAVRTRPAPAPRVAEPEIRKAAPAVRGAIEAPKVESLKDFKKGLKESTVLTQEELSAPTCSLAQFAQGVSKGTGFTPEQTAALVSAKLITRGNCGENGLEGYAALPRYNFLAAGTHVGKVLNGSDPIKVPAEVMDKYWAEGLAEAKNKTLSQAEQVTVESQISVAKQLKEHCQLRAN